MPQIEDFFATDEIFDYLCVALKIDFAADQVRVALSQGRDLKDVKKELEETYGPILSRYTGEEIAFGEALADLATSPGEKLSVEHAGLRWGHADTYPSAREWPVIIERINARLNQDG